MQLFLVFPLCLDKSESSFPEPYHTHSMWLQIWRLGIGFRISALKGQEKSFALTAMYLQLMLGMGLI